MLSEEERRARSDQAIQASLLRTKVYLVLCALVVVPVLAPFVIDSWGETAAWEAHKHAENEYYAGQSAAQAAYWDCKKTSRHELPVDCDLEYEAWKNYSDTHPRPTYSPK